VRKAGRKAGREEGLAQGHAHAILLLLAERGIDIADDIRERITTCTDTALLTTWLTRTLTAASAEEVVRDEQETTRLTYGDRSGGTEV
jgi:hypothetical protein